MNQKHLTDDQLDAIGRKLRGEDHSPELQLEYAEWCMATGNWNISIDGFAEMRASGINPWPVKATPLEIFDHSQLPERQWLYGVHLIRGYSSATVAAPGTGKSTLAMIEAVSIALGRNLLTDHVHEQANVWIYNLEDPMEELKRRLAAVCIKFKVDMRELEGRLFMDSGRDRSLCVLARGMGLDYATPDKDGMIAAIAQNKIGAVFIDPFISSYEGDENNNKDVDRAVKTFNAIADATNCAIDLIHHTGKQTNEAGSQNAGRGGSSLVGAIRSMRTLVTMSKDEAVLAKISEENRFSYIRIDGAKSNMAKVRGVMNWVALESVNLRNGVDGGFGDDVAVLDVWMPPDAFQGLTNDAIDQCLQLIQRGPRPGVLYSPERKSNEWVVSIIADTLGKDEADAKRIAEVWLRNKRLVIDNYRNEEARRDRKGIFVNFDAPTEG